MIGTGSAALQIEGSLPRSTWHVWAETPGKVADGTSPNPTTDHWNRWREDNQLMADLNFQTARIGVDWARIEPEFRVFDAAALARYREEIDDLIAKGIHPLVTLHHFGHPLWFEELGAFNKQENIRYFIEFVERVLEYLGPVVSDWITINEPNVYATQAYLFDYGPIVNGKSWKNLRSTLRNLAVAHIQAYQLIHERIDAGERVARVGFAHHRRVFAPLNPKNPLHRIFTRVNEQLFHREIEEAFFSGKFGRFLGKPVGVKLGRYCDVIGINYYSRTAVSGLDDGVFPDVPTTDLGWEIYPQGVVIAARELYQRYRLPIWITENGTADNGDSSRLEKFRCSFILDHLKEIVASDLPIERYYHWCFVDNWEWSDGMEPRFGVVYLDRTNLERKPKPSAYMLRDLIKAGAITAEIEKKYRER
ncbi:glycoside hydrolase family 1 protein [Arcanobacterium bovis]|uniref:Glycoside hydrolase family 1 protein n=2 Tax=Arcanobacterium bovis TaxID=2529275 RepID=A0A4Q9V0T7_9ACTO|nr:glycoside hydrolase family 1 protein [Arcanobacterium bovis]